MLLIGVVLFLTGMALAAAIALNSVSAGRVPVRARTSWAIDRIAVLLVVIAVLFIALRSRLFGVDTAAYLVVFDSYCVGQGMEQLGASFFLSSLVLNGMMLGACDAYLLPLAWVSFLVLAVALANGTFSDKLRYLALLLVSLVGIELTTNALRQGLSVAVLVAAVSWIGRRNGLAAALAVFAVALHSSAALVLSAVALAAFSWRVFLVTVIGGVAMVAAALQLVTTIGGPVGSFLYEVQKYLAHEADELWIRVLSLASLTMVVIIPRLFATEDERAVMTMHDGDYARAIRLASTCVPFILLPYFGYRYIYGVLPIVLWILNAAVRQTPRLADRMFGLVLVGNLALLLVWSYGSGYMRSVPFFE